MAKLIRGAFVVLVLPDGKVVLQRRTPHAPTSPGLLFLYGGRVENCEGHLHAIKRELSEETSLSVNDVKLTPLNEYAVSHKEIAGRKDRYIYIYQANINSADFKTHEGVGPEVYTIEDALKREDLVTTARYALMAYLEARNG